MAGLLNFVSNDQLVEREQAEIKEKEEKTRQKYNALGLSLANKYDEWKRAKEPIELRWLDALRAFNSQYDADTKKVLDAAPERSKVYVGLTRTKVMAAYSRLIDLLFQSSDSFWGIDSTPSPEMPEQELKALKHIAIQQVAQSGEQLTPDAVEEYYNRLVEFARDEFKDLAKEAAKEMEKEIKDILVEGEAEKHLKSSILEACITGSGCVKGATVNVLSDSVWSQTEGQWSLDVREKVTADVESVSVFDIVPDPFATSMDDMEGLFRRHVLNRSQFRALAKNGFSEQEILASLVDYEHGNHTLSDSETARRNIAGMSNESSSNRFEVLEYWGTVDGRDLRLAGVQVENEQVEYQANVWICGNHVLKARLNPLVPERIPYNIFPYERVPHQFWGIGVPEMMKDSQTTMNAGVRIFVDNAAVSSGPMGEINVDMIPDGMRLEDFMTAKPWKLYPRSGGAPEAPMIRWNQPSANGQAINHIIEMFRRFADEETSLPSYTHGETGQGLNKTASGMSMLMGAANVAIKSVVKNFDDYLTKPLIQSLFDFCMKWSDNEEAKSGDIKVMARGSTALISKELQSQRLMQFTQMTVNPVDMQLTDRKFLLKSIAESLDINADKALLSDEQIQNAAARSQLNPSSEGEQPALGSPEQVPAQST
ncbi:hypothetical protein DN730_08100 [Marinomonas piezotolerans]|uniref:Portal protein n=1 Tax=Marinomonas piezotolerans TaxID=2213058 RepID=A0A370U988_9GAMM|nr:hypothetical protein [Marinomonas piezotolerans]RDL44356.1 hypothetical protein DN730_08100 [Marinomonas piezotolerans]